MAKNKDSNDWIRKAVQAGNTVELTHSEMNDLLRGKRTVDEIKADRKPADRDLTIDDMVAITEYLSKKKVSWAKAREAHLASKAKADKQHPMSAYMRIVAGRQTKTENGE